MAADASVWPSRLAPRSKWSMRSATSVRLAGHTVKISVFLDEVGREVYGDSWPNDAASLLKRNEPAKENQIYERVQLIHNDLVNAFYSQLIEVVTHIPMKTLDKSWKRSRSHYRAPEGSQSFALQPIFWESYSNGGRTIDWENSITTAQWEDLEWSDVRFGHRYFNAPGNIDEGIKRFTDVKCEILVFEPLEAFQSLFKSLIVPDEQWFKRYATYRKDFMLEVTTAAWRHIASSPAIEREKLTCEKLVAEMQAYLDGQIPGRDFDKPVSDPALRVIASKVMAQLRTPNPEGSVLVNSRRNSKRNNNSGSPSK